MLNQRLNILYHLTGTPSTQRSYTLSMNIQELRRVITSRYKYVSATDVNDENVIFTFQVNDQKELFLISHLLLTSGLNILSFIEVYN